MILPTGATTFAEGLRYAAETYSSLKKVISTKFGPGSVNVGDEGGFGAPEIGNEFESLDIVMEAIKAAKMEGKITIGMDVAASEFYDEGKYNMGWKTKETGKLFSGDDMINRYN